MRYLQAGGRRLVALEPDAEVIRSIAEQAGFECELRQDSRQWVLDLKPSDEIRNLLLFDATDPANLGWFSRCQFYVDGLTGAVLQTPLTISNCREGGRLLLDRVRVAVATELPARFRLPGRQNLSEQVVYSLLFNLLSALKENGVAVCGNGSIQPLAGSPRHIAAPTD